MKLKFKKYCSRYRGMTLVEVVAGMALLGTLLVSIVMATAKLTAQSRLAAHRVEAYLAADQLLFSWWSDWQNFPRNESGTISGHDDWRWRTFSTDSKIDLSVKVKKKSPGDQEIEKLDIDLVTLEILEIDKQDILLASVQVLIAEIKNDDDETKNRPDSN